MDYLNHFEYVLLLLGVGLTSDEHRTLGKDVVWPPKEHPGKKRREDFQLTRTIPTHDMYHGDCPVKILTRDEWGALAAKGGETHDLPLTHVRFTDTKSEQCFSKEECIPLLQRLQKDHMEKEGLSDIKYNFMVGSDGTIYEGRGWYYEADRPDEEQGVVLTRLKGYSCDIAYIGTFDRSFRYPVPPRMGWSGFDFIAWASEHQYLYYTFGYTLPRKPQSTAADNTSDKS